MKNGVFSLPVIALSVAFLAACSDSDSGSDNKNPAAANPELASSSSEILQPASSDIAPSSSSAAPEVPEKVDPAEIPFDEDGFADIQYVYRSLQPNEKAVFALRHGERGPHSDRQEDLTEDGVAQAQSVGQKLIGSDEFTFTHTDFVRTYNTCLNIAIGRGQATFPNDTNDTYTEGWFVSNDSLYKAYSKAPSSSHMVLASWAYNGEYTDAFYNYNEKNAELVKMLVGDYATASRVRIVCTHDNLLGPLAIYLTDRKVNLRAYEVKKWIYYLAGVAIITNDAGEQRAYAVKGLSSGAK